MKPAWVVVAVLALLGGMWAQAQAQGPAILETGCFAGNAWVLVAGEGAARYAWFDTDQATGGQEVAASDVNFERFDVWRIAHAGQGQALRFELGELRAYFGEGCVPLAGPAPVSPLAGPARASVEQRLYLPQVGR